MYNEGISKAGGLIDVGIELAIVRKTGSFFSFGDVRLGQGRENAKEFLKKNPEISAEIERLIREQTIGSREAPGVEANGHLPEALEAEVALESVL
jgi:recombination protein RecA